MQIANTVTKRSPQSTMCNPIEQLFLICHVRRKACMVKERQPGVIAVIRERQQRGAPFPINAVRHLSGQVREHEQTASRRSVGGSPEKKLKKHPKKAPERKTLKAKPMSAARRYNHQIWRVSFEQSGGNNITTHPPFDPAVSDLLEALFRRQRTEPVYVPTFDITINNHHLDRMSWSSKDHKTLLHFERLSSEPGSGQVSDTVYYFHNGWQAYNPYFSTLVMDAKRFGRKSVSMQDMHSDAVRTVYLQGRPYQINGQTGKERGVLLPNVTVNEIIEKPVASPEVYERVLKKVTEEIQHEISCPCTQDVMQTPVVAEDGNTYEFRAISRALSINGKSPLTGAVIGTKLIPNHNLRKIIESHIPEDARFGNDKKKGKQKCSGETSSGKPPKKKKQKKAGKLPNGEPVADEAFAVQE